MSDTESAGGGEGVAGAEASGAGASGAGAVCPADQPNISVTMDEPVGLTKETLDSLKFADQDPQEYDPIRVGMATNDLDLDEVNDNLPDFAAEDNLSLEETSTTASQSKDTNAAGNESEATASNSEAGGDSSMHDSLSSHQGAEQSNSDKSLSMAESRDCETLSNHSADVLSHVSKRNSLEVRNNIPDVAEVKSYSDDSSDDIIKYQGQGAIPKIIKKSPGLARRLVERTVPDNRDSSSSEREMDLSQPPFDNTIISAQKDFETKLRNGTYSPRTKPHVGSSRNSMEPPSTDEEHYDNVVPPSVEHKEREQENGLDARAEVNKDVDGLDVLNEYDYVKYARIQHGDSYVGMRLAYSSSNDSLVFRDRPAGVNRVRSSDDEHYISSSREGSPEKVMQRPRNHLPETMRVSNVNEETLTEIPLNGNEGLPNETERRNFSLSPEATDCDSAEVESVLSEEGKSSTSGMPIVEDGLSSSQGSDTEDTSTQDVQRPAEILKRRHKAEIEQELQNKLHDRMLEDSAMSSVTDNSSELSTPSHDNGAHRIQREALDLAIKDIQSAIQRSKSMTLKSPSGDANGEKEEPVWVMRDSYVRKLQKQDDVRKAHKEYEKQREEEYTTKEQEHVYQVEDEGEGLMKYQYTHNDGKVYQTTRGFDSDDDYQDSERHQSTRRNIRHVKGKKYASLPADDPVDAAYFRVRNVYYPPNYSRYASRVDRDGMKHGDSNSDSERHYVTNQDLHDHDAVPRPSSHAHNFSSTISQSRYRTENNGESLNTSSSTSEQYSSASRTSDDSQSSPSLYGANNYSSPSSRDSHQGPPLASRETYRIPEDSEEEEYIEEVFHKPSAYIRQRGEGGEYDTDEETDELLDKQYVRPDQVDIPELSRPPINRSAQAEKRRSRAREVALRDPDNETVLIEGVLFRARYLGSTQLISEGQPSKAMRMMQAQEAVGRIKAMGKIHFGDKYQAPEGESQPSTEVDLFISTEKLMVLNTDLQEIMMDHSLRTISYIADIGDVLVLMARRGPVTSPMQDGMIRKRQSKICCHVFDTEEAQLIAQSIGQAFQVAYMEFLKANGIEDPGLMKEMDYQEVLNQQEIFGEELYLFANKEMQKEVIVPKLKGELLGIVIVESGWGSMVPTVVLANMSPTGAAARCGQLNIGDQIMSINGVSLVGLPLSSCQTYIKAAKNQTVVKLTVVSCPPVVEVCIKRPDVKYQLGFSVQNGVICSLLRGGIAERGGVRVGHRIIEINSQSVVAVAHDKIVNMLATSVGEIHMKTMPTSIYRLLTGQDTPHYM